MLRNYLKLAFRNIQQHTSFSLITLSGLTVGVSASIVIGLYALNILTFDFSHVNKDRIFLAYKERITPSGIQPTYDTWIPLAESLKENYPEIVASSRTFSSNGVIVQNNKEFLNHEIVYTDESLFDIFTFESFKTSNANFFADLNSAVITESVASKVFADNNPIGQSIELYLVSEDTTLRFQVSSVIKDPPINSSIQGDIFIQMKSLPEFEAEAQNWSSSFISTWVLLNQSGAEISLEKKFPMLISRIWNEEVASRTNFKLLPLNEAFDTFNGDSNDAWIMVAIALGILIIASINFMNLATARASYRSREIGLRKVMGAVTPQIRTQFLMESIIYTTLAMGAGLIIVFFSVPYANTYFDLQLSFYSLLNPMGIGIVLGIVLIVGILSGTYPAFHLSTISILSVLRKSGLGGGARTFRNGLMVIQFGLAVLLVCGALLVRNQLLFMYNKDMGFNDNGLIQIEASSSDFTGRELGAERITLFKEKLSNYSFVQSITSSRHVPTDWSRSFTFVRPKGWTGDPLRMRYTYVDDSFFETYGIEIQQGRDFLPDIKGHQRDAVILNKSAFQTLNLDTAIAPTLVFGSREIKVVGVVDDFNFESLRNHVEPTLHFHRTSDHPIHSYITIKPEDGSTSQLLEVLESEWQKLNATQPLRVAFVEESVQSMYQSENQFLGLVSFFTIISIFIACLGLYGLTLFVIERRQKEISIRKVIGADIRQLSTLVARDFAPWIGIAMLIGGISAYILFQSWVAGFYYQAPISGWVFVVSGLFIVSLVSLTIGFHTYKVAVSNPINYLRED